MKKSSGTKFHRIRIKLFAAILAVMILFMALVTVFSSPLLKLRGREDKFMLPRLGHLLF